MSLAAPARTDHVVKLLVTGPFAAGKTTLIGSISETPVVDTDVATTGDEASVKPRTTVAMDFGTYRVADDAGQVDLLLFGTPGQPRFQFMTDVMKGSVDAVISVVDGSDESTHPECRCRDAGVATRPPRSPRRRRQPLRRPTPCRRDRPATGCARERGRRAPANSSVPTTDAR